MTATAPPAACTVTAEPVLPLLRSNEIEAANRAEATALLIRAGYRVYRPEADVNGEDLVLRDPAGRLRSVQLKGRPYVEWKRYGGSGTWMLFPDPVLSPGRPWFLIEHDTLFAALEGWHGHTAGWKADPAWGYPRLTKKLRAFLAPYSSPCWPSAALPVDAVKAPAACPTMPAPAGT